MRLVSCSTWRSALQKARENVIYVEAFKRYLENPVTLEKTLKDHKDSVDASRCYDELKLLRELAVFYLKRERGLEEERSSQQQQHEEEDVEVAQEETEVQDDLSSETQPATYMSTLQAWFPLWGGWYADKEADYMQRSYDLDQVMFYSIGTFTLLYNSRIVFM